MTTLFSTLRHNSGTVNIPARSPVGNHVRLTRTYVETGDERCPLAGIWLALPSEASTEEPELARPVLRMLLPGRAMNRAFHRLFMLFRYTPA